MTAHADFRLEPFTTHGGRLDAARAAFPHVTDWIDLSTGVAPWPYAMAVTTAADERLPSPVDLASLEAAAAAVFGADPELTVAVPGSDLGLRLLGRIIGDRRVAVVRPGYSGHVAMWGPVEPTPIELAGIAAAVTSHDVVVLARPNNPDGAVADRSLLRKAAADLAHRSGHLIVDEAFADALPVSAVVDPAWPATIVLRSFGKFFGLAGLRLGFVVGPPAIVRELRRMLGDWPISGTAIAIGTAAYRDRSWQGGQRAGLADASRRLDGLLVGAGLTVTGGTALYRLISAPRRAINLFAHLAAVGILTRPFAGSDRDLRFGLPRDRQWQRLESALDEWSTR